MAGKRVRSRKMKMCNTEQVHQAICIGICVAKFLLETSRIVEAIELLKECLIPLNNKATSKEQEFIRLLYKEIYDLIFYGYVAINDDANAIEWGKKLLITLQEFDERGNEKAMNIFQLAQLYKRQRNYRKASELFMKALHHMTETGNRTGEAACCRKLASVFLSIGEFVKAKEYLQRALYISNENGDKCGEAACYRNLGTVFRYLGEYVKATEYLQKALQIEKEVGNKYGEATCYNHIGIVFQSRCEYVKAEEYLQKALQVFKEIGDKRREASCHGNLGNVFQFLGDYVKAEEYLQKALQINKEIGDKREEATCQGNLGAVFQSLAEYVKAEEYVKKALQIKKEIGDKRGEAACLITLGTMFYSLGEHVKAAEYLQKALQINKEICGKPVEATCHGELGNVFLSLGKFVEAEEYHQKALQICKEIGDKRGEAICQGNLGTVFLSLGKYVMAEEHLQKALQMQIEIGNKNGEASCYLNLGILLSIAGEYVKAEEYHEKALALSYECGYTELQFCSLLELTLDRFKSTENMDEAMSSLLDCIQKCEEMRDFLKDHDQFNISFLDYHASPYKSLCDLFCYKGNYNQALYVVELGRARALADMLSAQYSVEQQISVNPRTWFGIERIVTKESHCACLYVSYLHQNLFLWVIKPNESSILFRHKNVNDCFGKKNVETSVDEVFGDKNFRKCSGSLTQEYCEDRSLFPSNTGWVTDVSSGEDEPVVSRLVEEDEDENQHIGPPNFAQCYEMIIAPVAELLDQPEIIVVPDRFLYKVPFAALQDESGKYFSESFRIRIVPSLTTLKLIQDSPADYHSQTGVLIVGEPDVSDVYYKGRLEKLCPLPCAREEAEMIGDLLGAQPLLGDRATKQAVLRSIHSVSLIHVAAHGNAERGEIALAPPRPFNGIPEEQDYLLTMTEISRVRLRAKLVVLSCCHSARGQIRPEGVVGIARAFLGSGARSVLVALWAIQDKATKEFMTRFYEHLVRGESASESLHRAMKWMRANDFSDVDQWAPFMLIGDNVSFDFGSEGQ